MYGFEKMKLSFFSKANEIKYFLRDKWMCLFNYRKRYRLPKSDSLLFIKHLRESDVHIILFPLVDHLYVYQLESATRFIVPSNTSQSLDVGSFVGECSANE